MEKWPVKNSMGQTVRHLEMPVDAQYRNDSVTRVEEIKNKYGSLIDYFKQTEITCDALLGNKVVITAEGIVMPCNFFEHNLYDARFHEDTDPGSFDPLGEKKYNNQIIEITHNSTISEEKYAISEQKNEVFRFQITFVAHA